MIPNPWIIVGFLVLLIAAAFGGSQVGMKLERSAWLKKDNAELAAANVEIQRLNDAARKTEREHQTALAAIGEKYETDAAAREAQHRTDLANARSGALKLRVPGACKADPGGGGKAAPAAGGSDDPTTGELPTEVAANLLDLANDADTIVGQLAACQAVVTSDRKGDSS